MSNNVGKGNVTRINNELKVTLKNVESQVFLQGGFYRNTSVCDYMHVHNYTEIHLVINGTMSFMVGDKRLTVDDKTALVIPKGIGTGRKQK